MLTILNLANFANYAYSKNINDIAKGFRKIADSDDCGYDSSGYYGVVFANESSKEIVIASSGTNIDLKRGLLDLVEDLFSDKDIMLGLAPEQFTKAALPFAATVLASFGNEVSNYEIYFTGHSLGAVLAELTKVKLELDINLTSKVISFDSPGSSAIIHKLINGTAGGKIAGITSYNGEANLINSCHEPAGEVYLVKTMEYQPSNFLANLAEGSNSIWVKRALYVGDLVHKVVEHTRHHHSHSKLIEMLKRHELGEDVIEKQDDFTPYGMCSLLGEQYEAIDS